MMVKMTLFSLWAQLVLNYNLSTRRIVSEKHGILKILHLIQASLLFLHFFCPIFWARSRAIKKPLLGHSIVNILLGFVTLLNSLCCLVDEEVVRLNLIRIHTGKSIDEHCHWEYNCWATTLSAKIADIHLFTWVLFSTSIKSYSEIWMTRTWRKKTLGKRWSGSRQRSFIATILNGR